MRKPEVSSGVVFAEEDPDSGIAQRAGRAAREAGSAIMSRAPFIGPDPCEEASRTYELKCNTTEDAVVLTHALRDLIDDEQKVDGALVKLKSVDDERYGVLAVAQIEDDPEHNKEVTNTFIHVTSPTGLKTHLGIEAEEFPLEPGEQEPEAPKVKVFIANENGKFGIEDYGPEGQQQFAHLVHKATTDLVEHGQPTTPVIAH